MGKNTGNEMQKGIPRQFTRIRASQKFEILFGNPNLTN